MEKHKQKTILEILESEKKGGGGCFKEHPL